jgi:putative transposase
MPRPARVVLDGVPMHHIQRGNRRRAVFHDDDDRVLYRELLLEGAQQVGCRIHAYVLMTNHVHLLLTPVHREAIAQLTQWMGRRYVSRFNRRHGFSGALWEGRYRASLINSARYFLTCSRYIDQNPVRAGLVRSPRLYRWSSYARLAYGDSDALVVEHDEYLRLGADAESRRSAYRELCEMSISDIDLAAVRSTVQRGAPLGEPAHSLRHGGDRRSAAFREQVSPSFQGVRPLDRGGRTQGTLPLR